MTRVSWIAFVAACSLLVPLQALAHHGDFYKRVFRAVQKADIDGIKPVFTKAAWEGTEGAMSAGELQARLKKGRLKGLFENSEHAEPRSKCLVAFKLEYPDKKVEPIWLLAEDFDPEFRQWDWRVVRIVTEEKEAQAFFKHSYSLEFSAIGKDKKEATPSINPTVGVNR